MGSNQDVDMTGQRFAALALAALGVVYGDIGTSPLYAVKEVFAGNHPIPVTVGNIYGSLSLFFWALVIVVSIKYVCFIMRADNRGAFGGGDYFHGQESPQSKFPLQSSPRS